MNRLRHVLCLTVTLLALAAGQGLAAEKAPTKLPDAVPLSGKVVETMDSGGYTYLLLKSASGEKKWVAAPKMKVSVGQELTLMPGYEMKNLTSKTLNRTFDKIIFSGGLVTQKEIQMSPEAIKNAHKGMNIDLSKIPAANGSANKAAPAAKAAKPAAPVKVTKAKGGYTVAELWAKRAKLEKKSVAVRGRVVKVAPRIMKHNWVHIEDGTGSAAKKTNSLVITTKALPKEGDVVTAKGVLRNRLDFGAGYKYELIMMEASVK